MNILSADKIEQARANNHAAFIAYLSAGYPDVDFSIDVARAVVEAAAVVMSYYNPVFRYGVDNFARDLANAGGAGLIIADIIPEECGEWIEASDNYGLERIFLVAPTTSDERLTITAKATRGFVYAASRMGSRVCKRRSRPRRPRSWNELALLGRATYAWASACRTGNRPTRWANTLMA